MPKIGEKKALVDSGDNIVATIEITSVELYKLSEIDKSVAVDEGEGFHSVADWRKAHEEFWHPKKLDNDTQIIVERFKIL